MSRVMAQLLVGVVIMTILYDLVASAPNDARFRYDDDVQTPLLEGGKSISKIAFGSCGKPEIDSDNIWESIVAFKPELWVWLGGACHMTHNIGYQHRPHFPVGLV